MYITMRAVICLIIFSFLLSSCGPESTPKQVEFSWEVDGAYAVVIWKNEQLNRFAMDVDLTFGGTRTKGQINFPDLESLKNYLKDNYDKKVVILNGFEGSDPKKICRQLSESELAFLLDNNPLYSVKYY